MEDYEGYLSSADLYVHVALQDVLSNCSCTYMYMHISSPRDLPLALSHTVTLLQTGCPITLFTIERYYMYVHIIIYTGGPHTHILYQLVTICCSG